MFSDLQVPDVKRLLVHVDGVGARRQAAHGRQVTAVTPHGLYDEDPALGAAGRLFDAVTRLTHTHTLYSQYHIKHGFGHMFALRTSKHKVQQK